MFKTTRTPTRTPLPPQTRFALAIRPALTLVLALASALGANSPNTARGASGFADQIVSYEPGIGYAERFTQPDVALGGPSQSNPFGEPTDPFNPPYGPDQIVSIGAGGWLEVTFHTPVLNHPHNPHGLDFTIFGNSGFIITNDFDLSILDWVGVPATDGSLFGQHLDATRLLVSRDGTTYYELAPNLAAAADSFAPTDVSGDPGIPVAPSLTADEFAGATLEDMRTLYQGSAGGTSYDISWARNSAGQPVFLPEINFVRVEVLSGRSEIDAFAKVARVSGGDSRR